MKSPGVSQKRLGIVPIIDSTGDLIEVIPNSAVFGGQLPKRGKQLVVDRGNGDNGADACAPDGSADKLGLTDAVGRKAGGKIGVFILGHAGLDNTAAVRRVMVTLSLPLVRLDRSVFPPLPLLQSHKRFLATSANKAFAIKHPARCSPLIQLDAGDLAKPDTKNWTSNLLIFIQS